MIISQLRMKPPHILVIDRSEVRQYLEVRVKKPMVLTMGLESSSPNLDVMREADVVKQSRREVRQSFNLPSGA